MGGITHEISATSPSLSSWYQPHAGYEFVRLTADRVNSTTSLQDATGLTFALVANNFPVFNNETPISTTAMTDSNRRAVNTGAATTGIDTANANTLATIRGKVNPTSSENLQVRYASEVATSNAIIKSGSTGKLYTVT